MAQRRKKSKKDKLRTLVAGAGIALAVSALLALALILVPHETERLAAKPVEGRLGDIAMSGEASETIEEIDWEYWHSVNPDIRAWITIPGTPIDHPIVQASPENPTHYLDFDVYNNYNFYGCLYIDAATSIDAAHTIIYGHNMGYYDDGMFTPLTSYLEREFFASHPDIIIQTPLETLRLKVRAADEISPYGFAKETTFDDRDALRELYLTYWNEAITKTDEPAEEEIERLFTFITCERDGYTRVLVYAA